MPYSPVPMATVVRRVAIALLLWFIAVFAITTVVRLRFHRPVVYVGQASASSPDALPFHVGHTGAAILDARHHEQQIG